MTQITQEVAEFIQTHSQSLAARIVDRQLERQPGLWEKFGPGMRSISIRDAAYHFPFLTESISSGEAVIFTEYVAWAQTLFHSLQLPKNTMTGTLEAMRDILRQDLPSPMQAPALAVVEAGLAHLATGEEAAASHPISPFELNPMAIKYTNFLLGGEREKAEKLIMEAVKQGTPIKTLYLEVFQQSQYEIGHLWLTNKISVAKEHYCTAATQMIMSRLYPQIFSTQRKGFTFLAACVGGELHELGLRMVTDFFEMEGWDTYYLGANMPVNSLIKSIEENSADVLGLSASMPFHRTPLRETIKKIRISEAGRNIKILIGGNALNSQPDSWEKFGADGYAKNAELAVEKATQFVKETR